MAAPESRTARITISCTGSEREEIIKRSKDWKNISEFLIHRAIPDRAIVEAFAQGSSNVGLSVIREALANGTLPANFLETLPAELKEAVYDYRSAVGRSKEGITDGDARESFIPKQLPYVEGEESAKFQTELLGNLLLLPELGERAEGPASSQAAGAHLVRPGLIAGKRVIYLYPFFRHPTRRPYWGVVGYGRHETIGLLLRKELFRDFLGKKIEKGSSARGWLGLVIDRLCTDEKYRIGFRESFFEEEVAEVIWSRSQTAFSSAFESKREPISPTQLALTDTTPEKLNAVLEHVGLLVFDLLDEPKMVENAGEGWEVVRFPHEIPVPVGVGFSLSFLPRLLAHDNWQKIRDAAFAGLPKIQKDLLRSGITCFRKET